MPIDFENMTDEEFELVCETLLPAQKEAFKLIKNKEDNNGTSNKEDRQRDCSRMAY